MTPRPCRGGQGWGQCLLSTHNFFHIFLFSSLKSLTPPLSPPLQGRGNITYGIVLNTTSFVGPNSISFP